MDLLAVPLEKFQAGPSGRATGTPARWLRHPAFDQPGPEVPAHQIHDPVVLDIAGHRENHALRDVAPGVEGMQLIARHRRHRVDAADHRPTHRVVAEHR